MSSNHNILIIKATSFKKEWVEEIKKKSQNAKFLFIEDDKSKIIKKCKKI